MNFVKVYFLASVILIAAACSPVGFSSDSSDDKKFSAADTFPVPVPVSDYPQSGHDEIDEMLENNNGGHDNSPRDGRTYPPMGGQHGEGETGERGNDSKDNASEEPYMGGHSDGETDEKGNDSIDDGREDSSRGGPINGEIDKETYESIKEEMEQDRYDGGASNRAKYANMCRLLRFKSIFSTVALPAGGSIMHYRGILNARGTRVRNVSDFKGALLLKTLQLGQMEDVRGFVGVVGGVCPIGARRAIESVKSFKGVLLVCGLDIELVENFKGILVVVNGNIKQLKKVKGLVRVVNGRISEQSDNKAKIYVSGVSGTHHR